MPKFVEEDEPEILAESVGGPGSGLPVINITLPDGINAVKDTKVVAKLPELESDVKVGLAVASARVMVMEGRGKADGDGDNGELKLELGSGTRGMGGTCGGCDRSGTGDAVEGFREGFGGGGLICEGEALLEEW